MTVEGRRPSMPEEGRVVGKVMKGMWQGGGRGMGYGGGRADVLCIPGVGNVSMSALSKEE